MKYSEASRLIAADLLGTELICILDRNGQTKTTTLNDLKALMPIQQGTGLLLANPLTPTGYRFADPTGELPEPVPVNTPTVNNWQAASTTSMYAAWTDNQPQGSDAFILNVSATSDGQPVTGSPFRVSGVSNYTIGGLQSSTSYTLTMAAEAAGEQSTPTTPVAASTNTDVGGDFVPMNFLEYEGTVGQNLSGDSYMWHSAGAVPGTYTNDQVKYGNTACRFFIAQDSNVWGGGLTPQELSDQLVGNGDEVWASHWLFVPTDFQTNRRGSTKTKWQRWRKKRASDLGTNHGYMDLGLTGAGNPYYHLTSEFSYPIPEALGTKQSDYPWETGTWVRWEWYVKLTNNNSGIARLWRNGELVGEILDFRAFQYSDEFISDFLFFDFFNDRSEKDQWVYVDNLVLATSNNPPTATDAAGNKMIGDYRG